MMTSSPLVSQDYGQGSLTPTRPGVLGLRANVPALDIAGPTDSADYHQLSLPISVDAEQAEAVGMRRPPAPTRDKPRRVFGVVAGRVVLAARQRSMLRLTRRRPPHARPSTDDPPPNARRR